MSDSGTEILEKYRLLEYEKCVEVGLKAYEQLNKLAIASLFFNGSLAAALGFLESDSKLC